MTTKTRQRKRITKKGRTTGRLFKATFYAPTEDELNEIIESLNGFAIEMGLEPITVIEKKPVGSRWRAKVATHNWSPLKWIKSRFSKEKREAYWEEEEAKKKERWEEDKERREAELARAAARQARAEEARAQAELVRKAETKRVEAKRAAFKAEHPRVEAARVKVEEAAAAAPGVAVRAAKRTGVEVGRGIKFGVGKITARRVEEEEEITYTPGGRIKKTVITRKPGKRMSIFPTMEAARGLTGKREMIPAGKALMPGSGVSALGQMVLPGGNGGLAKLRQSGTPRINLFGGPSMQEAPTATIPSGLSEIQGKVYTAVVEDKARSMDAIIQATGLETGQINRALKALKKKNLVEIK